MPAVDLKHGNFSWVDLMTTDAAAAKGFYGTIFGWSAHDQPTDQAYPYTMFAKGEESVAGMGQMSPEMQEQGMRTVWTSYILVDDLDAAAAKAQELGATLLMPPMDAMDAGRMCMIQEPSGATVALWQEGTHCGAGLFNEHGTLSWNEVVTRDPAKAKEFFTEFLGWGWEEMTLPNGETYWVCMVGDRPNGGIMRMTHEWPEEAPPHVAVYFQVDDVDAAEAKAHEMGASTHIKEDIQVGRIAVIQDPQGGIFTLFKPNQPTP